jgi:hypothetical protein
MSAFGLVLVAVAVLAVAVIIGGGISVLRIRAAEPAQREQASGIPARVLCPILGEVTRVRLGKLEDGRLGVIWCAHFGDAQLRCDRSCFGAAIAGSLA